MPLARIGYPLGVVAVFCGIFFSAFFSYRFFLVMIGRATALESLTAQQGVTFHLGEYQGIASRFSTTALEKKEIPTEGREKISVVFKNAQLRNDRVMLLQELLKNDGWSATVIEENEIRSESITTIAAKETQEKGAEAVTALLIKNGFIVTQGKPIPKEEKFDIAITLGAY